MPNILRFVLLISMLGMGWIKEQRIQVGIIPIKTIFTQSHFLRLNQKKMSKKIRSISPMMMG